MHTNPSKRRYSFVNVRYLAVFFLLLACATTTLSQVSGFSVEPDTVPVIEEEERLPEGPKARIFEGRPGKATLFSLIVPGAGQIYNGSYWKAPIVWGVVGSMGTVMAFNIDQYNEFDQRYIDALTAEMEGMPNPDPSGFSSSQLFDLRNEANRNRQLTIILFSFVWLGNAVEAYVDAHLKEFDISDDLSIRYKPFIPSDGPGFGRTGIVVRF